MELTFSSLVLPYNESERLKALRGYEILDTPQDHNFDKITELAASIFKAPVALISLVDTDRIWYKSKVGLNISEAKREPGLCASAILVNEVYLVENAATDPRTQANPYTKAEEGIRFYAAAPLRTKEGLNLGTLCIMDYTPRTLNEQEKEQLTRLAGIIMDELELRLSAKKAIRLQTELISMAAHDFKNPLCSLLALADELSRTRGVQELPALADHIRNSASNMLHTVDELMSLAALENGKVRLKLDFYDINDIAEYVIYCYTEKARQKGQTLKLQKTVPTRTQVDYDRLKEIIDNLVSNAIKYSPAGSIIEVILTRQDDEFCIEVKDQGQGLTELDKERIFSKFTRLSAIPTGGESATGLGLAIVKMLVDLHGGHIKVFSLGRNKGTTFKVLIPLVA